MLFRKRKLGASLSGVPRIRHDEHVVGNYYLNTTNRFIRYEQLACADPYVSTGLIRLGLTVAGGLKVEVEGTPSLKEDVYEWADGLGLSPMMGVIARLLARDGTVVLHIGWEGDTITSLTPLPMAHTTLLPKGVKVGEMPPHMLRGEVRTAVLSEMSSPTVFDRSEFSLFRLFPHGYTCEDIIGRQTLGIYGVSLLEPLERTVKYRLDLLESFAQSARRHGLGRLYINLKAMEPLLAEGRHGEIKQVIDDVKREMAGLEQNQDIVGVGLDVRPIGTPEGLDIVPIKESLERDIAIGLLQSEVTTGKAKGSTYASSYVSERDRLRVLNAIRRHIAAVLEHEVVRPQIAAWGYGSEARLKLDALEVEKD
ncbi:MAG: hypothetical protein ACXQS2_04600 [Methermicoccaceae archaeon]